MHVAGLKMPEAYDGKCNNRNGMIVFGIELIMLGFYTFKEKE